MAKDYVLALLPSGGVELMATPRNQCIVSSSSGNRYLKTAENEDLI
jgi:hypothetical protein